MGVEAEGELVWRCVYWGVAEECGGVAGRDEEHTQYGNLIHRLQDGTGREES